MFDAGTLDGFKGAVNLWLLLRGVFFLVFYSAVLVGLQKQFLNNFVFTTWDCAAGFNNNDNDDNNDDNNNNNNNKGSQIITKY